MSVQKFKVWMWIATMVGTAIGIWIFMTVTEIENMPSIQVLMGGYLIYGSIMAAVLFFTGRSKMPTYDERKHQNVRKFFAYASTSLLALIGLIILGLYIFGINEVEIGLLAIFFLVAYWILGIGSFITSKL